MEYLAIGRLPPISGMSRSALMVMVPRPGLQPNAPKTARQLAKVSTINIDLCFAIFTLTTLVRLDYEVLGCSDWRRYSEKDRLDFSIGSLRGNKQ